MTAQVAEILHYRDCEFDLCAEPLELYLINNGIQFDSECVSTACWRGYIGEWLIEDCRLYLIGISDLDNRQVALSEIFPNNPGRVFAHWVTGELRCPQGKVLSYVHMGYSSIHERDLFLEFRQGELVAERLVSNGESSDPGASAGYGPEAWTTMPSGKPAR